MSAGLDDAVLEQHVALLAEHAEVELRVAVGGKAHAEPGPARSVRPDVDDRDRADPLERPAPAALDAVAVVPERELAAVAALVAVARDLELVQGDGRGRR